MPGSFEELIKTGVRKSDILAQIEAEKNLDSWIPGLLKHLKSRSQLESRKSVWILRQTVSHSPQVLSSTDINTLLDILYATRDSSVIRDILKIFTLIEVSDQQLGKLVDRCFYYLKNDGYAVAVHYNCLNILNKTCIEWPDLVDEFETAITPLLNSGTKTFQHHVKVQLTEIRKIKKAL